MLTEEERQAIVSYRLEKAENALKQVEANIANEFEDVMPQIEPTKIFIKKISDYLSEKHYL